VAALLSAVALASSRAGADDEKTPTIKEVMRKLHKGANAPLGKLKAQLKEKSPPWKAVQDEAKDFVTLGGALSKNDPPRGDKEAYKKLADAYFDNAKALDDAAQKEDATAAQGAFRKISGSCAACHKAHRPS
jgi:cytochrome c556